MPSRTWAHSFPTTRSNPSPPRTSKTHSPEWSNPGPTSRQCKSGSSHLCPAGQWIKSQREKSARCIHIDRRGAARQKHPDLHHAESSGRKARLTNRTISPPKLPTPHCCDAVTVRYRTVLHRTGADFRHSVLLPSQAHKPGDSSLGSRQTKPFKPCRGERNHSTARATCSISCIFKMSSNFNCQLAISHVLPEI
jgi:hypothetical protein